jgi:hypothetical protein
MNPVIVDQLQNFLLTFDTSSLNMQEISSNWDKHIEHQDTIESVVEEVMKFETSATVIPLSIFTLMMHKHFKKLIFLESSLELLQQFHLQLVSITDECRIFPGDLLQLNLILRLILKLAAL